MECCRAAASHASSGRFRILPSPRDARRRRFRAVEKEKVEVLRADQEKSRAPVFFFFFHLRKKSPLGDSRQPNIGFFRLRFPDPLPPPSPKIQIAPCPRREVHDWAVCPYAHAGEKARRRDPSDDLYTGIACPSMKSVSFASFEPRFLALFPASVAW